MVVICLLIFVLLAILVVVDLHSSDINDFEIKYSKYDVKVIDAINANELCWNCAYFYDGIIDSYPYVSMDDRPHPHCCVNRKRCLENKYKCYIKDNL